MTREDSWSVWKWATEWLWATTNSRISLLKCLPHLFSMTQPHLMWLQGILMSLIPQCYKSALTHIPPQRLIFKGLFRMFVMEKHCQFKCQSSLQWESLLSLKPRNVGVSITVLKTASPLSFCLGRNCHRQRTLQGLQSQGGSYEGSLQLGETGHHQPVCDWRWRQSDWSQRVQDWVEWTAGRPGPSW